jgi:beta-N-acetylhexosaminidase
MRAVVEGSTVLAGAAEARATAALARIASQSQPFDAAEARARFQAAFEGRWAA